MSIVAVVHTRLLRFADVVPPGRRREWFQSRIADTKGDWLEPEWYDCDATITTAEGAAEDAAARWQARKILAAAGVVA